MPKLARQTQAHVALRMVVARTLPRMKRITLLLLLTVLFTSQYEAVAQRIKTSLNDDWRFVREDETSASAETFDDSKWERVNLPHSYNAVDAFTMPRGYYEGPTWYRKKLVLTPLPGKRYFIQFEGASKVATVYLNGNRLGEHLGGYTAFGYELTSYLKAGINNISVRVDNTNRPDLAPLEADFTFYGGIYRDVWLIETPSAHLGVQEPYQNSVWYTSQKVDSSNASIQIQLPVINQAGENWKGQLEARLLDPRGRVVQSWLQQVNLKKNSEQVFKGMLSAKNPQLWSPDAPNLYTVELRLVDGKSKQLLDLVRQPLGLRWYKFTPNEGFALNGKPLKLMGLCRHQDREGFGPALTDAMHVADVRYIKEMGGNFVRIAHYPQDPAFLDACDRLGVIAWEEIPIVNKITESEAFTASCVSQLKEMINQHRNHPSIVIWGYMNEVLIRLPKKEVQDVYLANVVTLAKKLDSLCRAGDPERYTAMALHHSEVYNKCGLADVAQITGWNLYHGWYHDSFEDFGKRLDKEHLLYPNRVHIISEYGAGLDTRLHSDAPNIYDFTADWGQAYHESYLKQIMERKYIAGASLWNLVDFGSEGRKETMPHINNKGMMTMNRTKKDVFFLYEAALNSGILGGKPMKPVVRIAETERQTRKVWFPRGYKHTKIKLKFYGNVDQATVFVNNREQGKIRFTNYTAYLPVVVTAGTNRVEIVYSTPTQPSVAEDLLLIEVENAPEFLADPLHSFKEVAINCGSTAEYTDPITKQVWQADKEYSPGSYGYKGGNIAMNWKRMGTQDYIAGTAHQPLLQTRRDSLAGYQFDVPPGEYEVELHWAETNPKAKNLIYDLGGAPKSGADVSAERSFSVWVNQVPMVQELNLLRDYGFNTAVARKTRVVVHDDKGIWVKMEAQKGNTSLSAIRVTRIF